MFKKILIPIDGSELALRAVKMGVDLARESKGEVVFLHAILPYIPPYTAEFDMDGRVRALIEKAAAESCEAMLKAAEDVARASGVKSTNVAKVHSRPEVLIDKTVKELGCDVIVIATHGRGAMGRFIMGSVTTRLLPVASVPLLVYRDQKMAEDFLS